MRNRQTIALAVAASLTIALSFLTQWFLLTRLGAARQMDSYFAALAVPTLSLYVLCDPLTRVTVRRLTVTSDNGFQVHAWTVLHLVLLLYICLALVLHVTAPFWVRLLVPGFSAGAKQLTTSLARLMLLGMVLQALSTTARAIWYAQGRFIWPAATAVIGIACSLIFLGVALPHSGVSAAAWAFDVRFATECLLLFPMLGPYRAPKWRLGHIGGLLREARPLMFGAAYFRADVLVDRFLTSHAPPGGLSLLYLAQQILAAVGQVLNQSIVAPVIRVLARLAHAKDWLRFSQAIRSTAYRLGMVVTVVALGVLFVPRGALEMVFLHKNLTSQDVARLATLMVALIGLLVGDALGHLAQSSFYAAADTRTPTKAGAAVYSLGLVVKIAGFAALGIIGLAWGTSLYYVLNLAVLTFLLRAKLRTLSQRPAPAATLDPREAQN